MSAPITVLLVDDDEMVRTSTREWLNDDGFIVHCASSGVEALQILAAIRCDAAVIDLQCGAIRGEDFLRQALISSPRTRYAVYTGSQSFGLTPQLRELGMRNDDVIYKPVASLCTLTDKILSLVKENDCVG